MRCLPSLVSLVALGLVACGSVRVPEDHLYRLAPRAPERSARSVSAVLRVEAFAIAPHLERDNLVAAGPGHEVTPLRYHRWAAPVDRLVTAAVLDGLRTAGGFAEVLEGGTAGPSGLRLSGRVLNFEALREDSGLFGVVRVAFSLRDERDGELLYAGEVQGRTAADGTEPAAAVVALNGALATLLEKIARIADQCATRAAAGPGGR